jgi:predicted ATPase
MGTSDLLEPWPLTGGPGQASASPASPRLQLHDLSKSFGASRVLDAVSMLVEPGELHGLVGENGSGKSTLVEALAMAAGMNAEGGSTGAVHRTHASESPLHEWLTVVRDPGAPRWGYFVRAETMHGLFTYLDTSRAESPWSRDPVFHGLSHGESFVALLGSRRFRGEGLFVMDEPEAGLSFSAQLHLVAELAEMARRPRTQVVLATHSPVLAAIPGASVLELGEHGIRRTTWDDLEVVTHHRSFLAEPRRYLRHVIDDLDDPTTDG